jgi:hypothetical protein
MLSLDCKAELESVSQLGDEFLTASYIPDQMEQLRRVAQQRDEMSDAQASRPAERMQQSGGSSVHAAAAAAPSIKHEPLAHSGHVLSLFGELQPDDEPAGIHQPGHAAAASASISLSEPMDDDGDSDVFAAFLGATSTEEVDEANQWFA